MGKLALWGAVEGLGKGMVRGQEQKFETQQATEKGRRAMRLEHFRQKSQTERTRITQEGAERRHEETIAQQTEQNKFQREMLKEMQEQRIGAAEEQFGREASLSRELQDMRTTGALNLQQLRSRSSQSKWQFTHKERLDPETGQSVPVTIVSDKVSGETWEQEGNKFIPVGLSRSLVKTPRNAKDAYKFVTENPENADAFLDIYGHLPRSFFREHAGLVETQITEGAREGGAPVPREAAAPAPAAEPAPDTAAMLEAAGEGEASNAARIADIMSRADEVTPGGEGTAITPGRSFFYKSTPQEQKEQSQAIQSAVSKFFKRPFEEMSFSTPSPILRELFGGAEE